MKHFGYESYSRWFVRIFFCKLYSKFKCAVFKRCVMWTVIENTQIWITQIHLTVKFAVALKKNPFTAWCFLRMLLSLSLFLYVKFGRKTPWLGFRKIPQGVFPTERFDRMISKLSKWSISYAFLTRSGSTGYMCSARGDSSTLLGQTLTIHYVHWYHLRLRI